MTVAAIRADAVNLPLFLHVLGAMLLVGALLAVVITHLLAKRADGSTANLDRLTLRTTLMGVLPAYFLMRIGAQWTESEEGFTDEPLWLDIGYGTAELGLLLVVISSILSVVGLRRLASGTGGDGAAKAVRIMALIVLLASLVAVWAMSAKPS